MFFFCDILFLLYLFFKIILDKYCFLLKVVMMFVFYEFIEFVKDVEEKILVGFDKMLDELFFIIFLEGMEEDFEFCMFFFNCYFIFLLIIRIFDVYVYVFCWMFLDLLVIRRVKDLSSMKE